MKQQNRYVVILAGGKGERLWPLSRSKRPKQLLNFCDNKSLLTHTLERISNFVPSENIYVVVTEEQKELVAEHVKKKINSLIIEPLSRNTAPAMLLACLTIIKKDPEALIAFLPADHYITPTEIFLQDLGNALDTAKKNNCLVLLGLKPTHPATGYGYIEVKETTTQAALAIAKFHEKPSSERAEEYFSTERFLWNLGIFCGPVTTFIELYQYYAAELFFTMNSYLKKETSYEHCKNISFDYEIAEKCNNLLVIPARFSWSDVGNLETFLSPTQLNSSSNIVAIDAHNNIVHVPSKLVALIGVNNLCIVETDDALLITHRPDVEQVKSVVQQLKKINQHQYL